jgi:branched-chain amino acid aminotransferase
MNGNLVDWDDAKIHVLSHVVHYGSSAFEGLRCYETPKGSAVFRLKDHVERLFQSAKIYRMEIPFTQKEIVEAIRKVVRVNELKSCYIRPIVWRGYGYMGLNPLKNPVEAAVAAWEWGKYLGDDAVDVCVSTWTRMAPNTLPSLAKAGANYMNSQLIKMEATINGYAEGIALDVNGYVSEGSGENIFIVKGGGLVTPPSGASILPGITRNCVIRLAHKLGIQVRKQMIPREGLYIADECFLTGSAAEITAVKSIDRIPLGLSAPGPMTSLLKDEFIGIVTGQKEDVYGWLEYV